MSPIRTPADGGHQQTLLHAYHLTTSQIQKNSSHIKVSSSNPYTTTSTNTSSPVTTSPVTWHQSTISTTAPLRSNEPWGSDIANKDESDVRILYQNANGISAADGCIATLDWLAKIKEFQVDSLGLSETNIAWHLHGNRHHIAYHFRQAWPSQQIRMATSNSSVTFSNSSYQPGGTMQLLGGKWTSHVAAQASDRLGRWSRLSLRGSRRMIHLITAYQVPVNDQGGSRRASVQQRAILAQEQGLELDPRKLFADDLTRYVTELLKEAGSQVILQLDANDTYAHKSSWLHRFIAATGLVDVHQFFHGTTNDPATYIRGSSRIDYIFVSPHLVPFVRQCGILPFDADSDHRPLWMDISLHTALRCTEPPPDLFREQTRGIHSSQKHCATKFKDAVYHHLHRNNFFRRLDTFRTLTTDPVPSPDIILTQATALDETLTQALLCGERKVSRHWTTSWTPALRSAKARIRYWKSWETELTTKRRMHRTREKAISQNEPGTLPPVDEKPTLQEAKRQARAAIREFRRIRNDAPKIREEFLLEQECGAQIAGHAKAKAIRRIRKREHLRKTRALLRRILPKSRSGALTHIKIPFTDQLTDSQEWKIVRDPAEMLHHLKDRNRKHFAQAADTPFATPQARNISRRPFRQALADLRSHFGNKGPTSDVLDELERLYTTQDISAHISGTDLEDGFKVWKEATSTSPSGRHLGLYKSILSGDDPLDIDSDNEEPTTFPLRQMIFSAMATIINACIDSKVVLPRWQRIVNLMLMKLHNNPRIDKLRVIHLMEADVNMWAGIIAGRRLLPAAVALNLIGHEQCGSVKSRSTYDVSGIRLFTMLTAELTRTDMGIFDNDAKACYDRIVLSLFYLRGQQLGLDERGTAFYDEWMSTAKYFLKTQLGVSEEFYQSTIDYYLHGPGQGGRASPPIWVIISALLFVCMNRRCQGATIHDPHFRTHLDHVMQAFVDDSTIWNNQFAANLAGQHDVSSLAEDLQKAAQYWEQLLHVSGGKLELPKCFYYLISWEFDTEGRPKLRDPSRLPVSLHLTDSETNNTTSVPRKDSKEATKTLGIVENPLHNSDDLFRQMKLKSDTVANALRAHPIPPDAAMLLYCSVYLPKMKFGLALAGHTDGELTRAQAHMKMTMLNMMGYSRATPHAVAFGPADIGGLGLTNLVHEQGLQQLSLVLQCLRSKARLGNYFRIYLRWYQLSAGTSFQVLDRPQIKLPHMAGKWMSSLRHFLARSEVRLHLPDEPQVPLHREHDRAIMDIAVTYTHSRSILLAINRVRLYLQVHRLSDITVPHGEVLYSIRHRNDVPSSSHLAWPLQPRPGPATWKTWQHFLDIAVQQGAHNRRLQVPLGKWVSPPTDRSWNFQYCPSTDTIYRRRLQSEGYDACFFTPRRRFFQLQPSTEVVDSVPTDSYPATAIRANLVQLPEVQCEHNRSRPAGTWDNFVSGLPDWETKLLQHVSFHSDIIDLLHCLTTTTVSLATDGGFRDSQASYGWILADDEVILCEGRGRVYGRPVSSFRAEIFGRLAAFRFILQVSRYMDVSPQKFQISSYCDNKSLIAIEKRMESIDNVTRTFFQTSDIDALMLLTDSIRSLSCRLSTVHVKSHQDLHTPYSQLSRAAQLNVEADALATSALQELPCHDSAIYLPNTCVCYLEDQVITGSVTAQIRRHVTEREFEKHLRRKHAWTVTDIREVHWSAYRNKLRKIQRPLHRFAIRLNHDRLPTAVRLFREGQAASGLCPRCNTEFEDYDHVLQCSHVTAEAWRQQFVSSLTQWLYQHHTPMPLHTLVRNNASTWLHDDETHIADDQDGIGWDCFFRGFLTTQWSYHVGKAGDAWTADLIEFVWTQTHLAWTIRCRVADDNTTPPAEIVRRQTMITEITELYRLQDQCYLTRPFVLPLEQHSLHSTREIEDWLTAHRLAIQSSHRRYRHNNPLRQTTIRDYFHRPRPPEHI